VATATSNDSSATPGRVQVFAARHELEHTTAHGSMVAPATSERVLAVGAVSNGERAAYSSLSSSGTVDVTAPATARTRTETDLDGTSAAAPYVAGTAALVTAAGHDPSPARVESILERTADGGDTVDALAAVEAVSVPAGGETADAPADARPDYTGASADTDTPARADATADTAAARTDRSDSTNAVDRTARNVTRSDGDGRDADGTDRGRRRTDGDDRETDDEDVDERTDRSTERNGDAGADRTPRHDRAEADNSTADDDRQRRDGTAGREGR